MSRSLFLGATVWAGAACVPARAWLLVEGDRIAAVGGEGEPPPRADRIVQLTGSHVLPGCVDVLRHVSAAAWFGRGGDGSGWRTVGDALDALRLAGAASPQAPWLLFWNVERWTWPQGRLPTAGELETAAPGRAVLISTADMHRGAISAAGLDAAGPARGPIQAPFGQCPGPDRRPRPARGFWGAAFWVRGLG